MYFYNKLKNSEQLRAIRISICIALFAFYSLEIYGQQKVDSLLLSEAYMHFENENFENAIERTNLAANQFIAKKNWRKLLECQKLLFEIGYLEINTDSIISSLENIHSSFPKGKEFAFSSYLIGYLEDERGNILKSLKFYESSIASFKKQKEWKSLVNVYSDIGTIYTQLGDYNSASKYINASLDLSRKQEDSIGQSIGTYSLAENYFFQDDYSNSKRLFRQYINLQPQERHYIYLELCDLFTNNNQLDSARFYFKEANKLNVDNTIPQSEFNKLYSDILNKEGNISGAINFILKCKEDIEISNNSRDKGKYFVKLANLYAKNSQLDTALLYFNNALKSFTNNEISIATIHELSQKKYLYNEIWIGDILIGQAEIFHKKFKQSGNKNFKIKAEESISLALESLDYKRSFFEDIGSSIYSNKKSKRLYEKAIDIFLDNYENSNDNIDLENAFQIAQRHNAFVLRQQINERINLDKHNVGLELKRIYIDQKMKVLEDSYALGRNYSLSSFKLLNQEEAKLDSIIQIINNKHPKVQNSKNAFNVTSSKKIQKNLEKNQAVIKYFEGTEKLYSFVITKNKLTHFVHKNHINTKQQINRIRSILSSSQYNFTNVDSIENEFLNVSFQLFKNILATEVESLPKRIKKLIIIPTGSLTQIPFESLISEEKKSWNDPLGYITNEYAVSYNYFCKELASPVIKKELEKVLSYGLEYDEYTLSASKKISKDSLSEQIIEKFRSEEMGHLYFAADEAQEIAEMFEGISFTNKEATKKNFLSNVSDYDIVHLSAHSFVDFQFPSNSSIIFSKKDSLTDNMLRIKDVDRMSLDGQLFTLSACNTFYGKKNEGEGLSSIARSFIQSGAGSVVGSFWSVPDEISKSFMLHFYSKLKDGLPKDEALQATKIDFMTDDNLSSPLYRSPAYWSAWVIYGDTQSITKNNKPLTYFGLAVLFFILFFAFKLYPSSNL